MGMAIVGAITPYVDWGSFTSSDRRYLPDNTNYFPVMAAAPTHINPAHSDTAASLILPNVKTIPYTLGALESPPTVAARFGITVDELRRLNQFRTFARGFDNVRQGDEIDVPSLTVTALKRAT